jgi:hypothetical protein
MVRGNKTANNNSSPLAKYMKFEFGCRGILLDSMNKNRYLLLGFPWFHSVCIFLDIPASIIQIGDPDICWI